MSNDSGLCDTCLACLCKLDTTSHDKSELTTTLTHHQSFASFAAAVQKPCLVCNYLASVWSLGSETLSFDITCDCHFNKEKGYRVNFNFQDKEPVLVYFNFIDEKDALLRHNEPLIAPHTSTDAVLKTARSWMDYCEAKHSSCTKHYSKHKYYPSRLVDLLPDSQQSGSSWRLIDQTEGLTGGYATLSHRWGQGSSEPFKLTKDTYDDMIKGLSDSCLHGTYRDAMRAVRELGLRYIWIDSLCVSQDPGTLDIEVAAYRMAEIYGHSSCNIGTLTARQDTMFTSRDPRLFSPAATMLPASTYGLNSSYCILLAKSWERSVLDTPLSRRGWILQEQLLPKRVLYFGEGQMLWTCLEGAFCELYPLDDITHNLLDGGMYEGDFGFLRSCVGHAVKSTIVSGTDQAEDSDDDDVFGSGTPEMDWMDLMNLYGPRHLSFAGDKLLAIAGLSQLLVSIKKDTLLGGLERSEMPQNLLWVMDHPTARLQGYGPIRASPVYRAPSWSWAYYDGPIAYYLGPAETRLSRGRPVAQIVDIGTDVKVVDGERIITGKDMRLLAASLPLQRQISRTDDSKTAKEHWPMPFTSMPSSSSRPNIDKELKLSCHPLDDFENETWEAGVDGTIVFDLIEYFNLQEPLTAIFTEVAQIPPKTNRTDYWYRFAGLVVRRHPNRCGEIYERVGIFAIQCHVESRRLPDVPMFRQWRFHELASASKEAEYDFRSADFMREFVIG